MGDSFNVVAQVMANTLALRCKAGASVNANFDTPIDGYMVAVDVGPVYAHKDYINPIEVAKYIRKWYGVYETLDNSTYVGVWTESSSGMVVFTISVNFRLLVDAMQVAKNEKEKAIWDVVEGCEIRVS